MPGSFSRRFVGLALAGILLCVPASSWAEAEEPEAVDTPIFWIEEPVVLASQKGKTLTLEPGLYRIEHSEAIFC